MNNNVKHRILGGIVLASIAVILLPFFQKDNLSDTSLAVERTPDFPVKTIQVSSVEAPATPAIPAPSMPFHQEVAQEALSTEPASTTTMSSLSTPPLVTIAPKEIKAKKTSAVVTTAAIDLDKNGLFKLKDPAWIIQIGRFNHPADAMRLARRLQANGYPVFVQQYRKSHSTHVFVKPENHPGAATLAAQQLEDKMHLHGIVMHYDPMV